MDAALSPKLAVVEDQFHQTQPLLSIFNTNAVPYELFTSYDQLRNRDPATFDVVLLSLARRSTRKSQTFSLIDRIRRRFSIPVITILDDRKVENEIVDSLNAGADDCITASLGINELVARLNRLHQRNRNHQNEDFRVFRRYSFNRISQSVILAENEVFLPNKEFLLALYLFENNNQLLDRQQILEDVWGTAHNSRTLDSHICKLKKKLELDGRYGWKLACYRGRGYRLLEQNAQPTTLAH